MTPETTDPRIAEIRKRMADQVAVIKSGRLYMSTDNPDDAIEFARQAVERGVLNEIVTEEQRQRQELEALIAEWRKTLKPGLLTELGLRAERQRHECAEQLAAILRR